MGVLDFDLRFTLFDLLLLLLLLLLLDFLEGDVLLLLDFLEGDVLLLLDFLEGDLLLLLLLLFDLDFLEGDLLLGGLRNARFLDFLFSLGLGFSLETNCADSLQIKVLSDGVNFPTSNSILAIRSLHVNGSYKSYMC